MLEPAHAALAEGRYEAAFALLEGAARRHGTRAAGARYWLHLAACYALYGSDGLEGGVPALRAAIASDPNLGDDPLYRALYWEFEAYRGGAASDVKRGLRSGGAAELPPVAAYHAAAALLTVGAAKSALRRLEALDPAVLPAYLGWRHASMTASAGG